MKRLVICDLRASNFFVVQLVIVLCRLHQFPTITQRFGWINTGVCQRFIFSYVSSLCFCNMHSASQCVACVEANCQFCALVYYIAVDGWKKGQQAQISHFFTPLSPLLFYLFLRLNRVGVLLLLLLLQSSPSDPLARFRYFPFSFFLSRFVPCLFAAHLFLS